MASSLTSLVPMLNSTNYQQWASVMKLYLMSQGQWKYIIRLPPVPKSSFASTTKPLSSKKKAGEEDNDDYQNALKMYKDLNNKAVGNICLHLHHTIRYQFRNEDQAHFLWEKQNLTIELSYKFQHLWQELLSSQPKPGEYMSKQALHPACTNLCTMQAHFENICQPQFNCYWQSHCRHMLRLHFKCDRNVTGDHIVGKCWGYISNVNEMYLVGTSEELCDKAWNVPNM